MIHYTCDRCKCQIESGEEFRYVVHLEVKAALDIAPEVVDDVDRDHLHEIHEILEAVDDIENSVLDDELFQQLRYDLCTKCYREFIRNPVGKEPIAKLNFSKN